MILVDLKKALLNIFKQTGILKSYQWLVVNASSGT